MIEINVQALASELAKKLTSSEGRASLKRAEEKTRQQLREIKEKIQVSHQLFLQRFFGTK